MRCTVGVALLVLLMDRASKLWVRGALEPLESMPIWPGIFHLTYVQNYGAAFGILEGRQLLFVLVTMAVVAALLLTVAYFPGCRRWLVPAAGLLVGGALGNLWDRLQWGYVVDFFDLRIWPVFNVADMAIVVGVGFFFWFWWRQGKEEAPKGEHRACS